MSVIRMIYCSFPPEQAGKAEQNWKEECAPLMIRQDGCISEQLLTCIDTPGELISWSEWEDEASIDRYLRSEDHKKIKRRNSNIEGAQVTVKRYTQVG